MTLTFELGTQVFPMTRWLHVRNICAKLFQSPPRNDEFTVQTSCIINIFVIWPLSMTLTFELGTWILCMTCRLLMRNICAKLFQNSPINDEFTVQTSCIMPTLNLWHRSVTLTYKLRSWVLCLTSHLYMVNICAKFAPNPSINDEFTVCTRSDVHIDARTTDNIWSQKLIMGTLCLGELKKKRGNRS